MKTLFSFGFQSSDPFTLRHPSLIGSPSLGRSIPLRQDAFMGQEYASSQYEHVADADAAANAELRAKLSAIIAQGTPKAAQVRSWIAGQAAKDPTLLSTFKDQYIVDNWHGYEDIINKDQASVDMASRKLASSDPANWDFSTDMIERVQEWNQVLDIMVAGMKEYGGGSAPVVKTGPAIVITNPKTGSPVYSSIAPGSTVTTKPPTSGVSTNTLLVGGGIAAAAIALILAMKA